MAKFKRYDSYKNSGVEWLGEIPSHWEILANKYIFKLKRNLVGKRSNKYVLLSLTLDGIVKRDLDKGGKFPVEFDTYQEVKNGDFVFCLFDVEETPRTIGLSEYDGMITGAYTVFDARNISKKYLYYFYLNLDNNKRLKPLYLGLRNTISKENFFSFKSFIPPKDEQEKIASYLDEKIAKIDTAISGKEKLIELLKEQKQIIINDAVTKGLNKNAKFKNSGVEWLGEIPSHWDIAKVSRFYQITIGKMLQPLKINFKDTLQDYICAANLGNNVLKIDNLKQMWFSETEHKLYKLKKGDLVVVEGGDIGSCDIIKFNTKDLFFQNSIHRVRAKKDNNVKFLRYWLINLKKIGYIDLICNKATIPHFTKEKFEDLICILPPKDEQEKIVEYIENKISKIDKLVNLEQECIKSIKPR